MWLRRRFTRVAVARLAAAMVEAGAYSGIGIRPEDAGTSLILSNSAFVDRLVMDGILPVETRLAATRPKVPAAMALQLDRARPAGDRLEAMALLFARVT